MRVNIYTGLVYWYRHLDAYYGEVTNDRFNGVIRNRNSSTRSTFVMLISVAMMAQVQVEVNNQSKLMIAHFDVNGALLNYSMVATIIPVPATTAIFSLRTSAKMQMETTSLQAVMRTDRRSVSGRYLPDGAWPRRKSCIKHDASDRYF
ncbi:MAG: hypothetical protein R3B47_21160 [Bacteroidia bacterium]